MRWPRWSTPRSPAAPRPQPPIGSPGSGAAASVVAAGLYGERFLAAIDAAMAVEPERRPQDHQQFRALMGDIDSPEPLELAPPRDLMHEPFVGDDGAREITVPDHPLLRSAIRGQARGRQGRGRRRAKRRRRNAAVRARRRRHAVATGGAAPSWVGGPARSSKLSASAPLRDRRRHRRADRHRALALQL
jgi:hypothetical protein